jgi:hypothetical protein
MMDNHGKMFKWSHSRQLKETGRLKRERLNLNHRSRLGILDIEGQDTEEDALRTVSSSKFTDYIRQVTERNLLLLPLYAKEKFRTLKWRGYYARQVFLNI